MDDVLSSDPGAAKKMHSQAAFYTMCSGELFCREFSSPLLKCLGEDQAMYVLAELHRGIWNALVCSVHDNSNTPSRVLMAEH